MVYWAILKWENESNDKYANRWLILIAYLMGLSIGVHLLNLLAIPAIVMVYYYKKYTFSWKGLLRALLVSVALLGAVMYGIIPGVVLLASWFVITSYSIHYTKLYEVKFFASYANNDSIAKIETDLREFDDIKEVYYQKNLIHTVNENVRKITFFILVFSGLLLLIAITLINNTIRLSVHSKRFLIRTMQLVGATAGYIRRPFLYRSMIQGFVGALFAISALIGGVYYLQNQLSGIIRLNDLKLLGVLFGIVTLLGIGINWISTYAAVTKYIRIKTDKLYH